MKRSRAGHTLAELMLASGISMMLLAIAGVMIGAYARNDRRVSQRGVTLQAMVVGMDRMRLEALEARSVEVPTDGGRANQLSFHRCKPGMSRISQDDRDLVSVDYALHPDGALWRKYVDTEGKVSLGPVAFDINRMVCTRKGPLLELQLFPREGPPVTSRVAIGRWQ